MNNGAFGENFPYSNFHDLNMDWIIKITKDFLDQYTHIQETIENGEQSIQDLTADGLEQLQTKADNLEELLQQWYNTHSEDIANELTDALSDITSALNLSLATFSTRAEQRANETIASIPADYSKLANDIYAYVQYLKGCPVMTSGTWNDQGGISATPLRASSITLYDIQEFCHVRYPAGYLGRAFIFTENMVFLGNTAYEKETDLSDIEYNNPRYFGITVENASDPTTDISANLINIGLDTRMTRNSLNSIIHPSYQSGTWNNQGTINVVNTRGASICKYPIKEYSKIVFPTGYNGRVFIYTKGGLYVDVTAYSQTIDVIALRHRYPTGYYMAIVIENSTDTTTDISNILNTLTETTALYFNPVNEKNPSPWSGTQVTFFGDSITAGNETTPGNRYYDFLDKMIDFFKITTNAVGGSCYSSQSDYGSTITPLVSRASNIPTTSDLVVIFAGTNDYGHGTPLGTIADTTDISFYGAVYQTITTIISNNPDVNIAVLTPLHREGDSTPNAVGKTLKDYVNAIIEVCEKTSTPVINTFATSGLNPNLPANKTLYFADAIHPNATGHQRLANVIVGQLNIY